MMKKALSLFLSLIMITISLAMPYGAFAEDTASAPLVLNNPFYEGREVYFASPNAQSGAVKTTLNGKTYYPDGEELYSIIKDKLLSRSSAFTLSYVSTSKISTKTQTVSLLDTLFAGATEEELSTGRLDGDYLRWSVSRFGASSLKLDESQGKNYYYTINFAVYYYSSLSQEQQVSKEISSFISKINTNTASDYQIIKSVHDYICSKSVYDYKASENPNSNPDAITPYGALISGKSVCQGYALAFYRICKELGYSVRFVSSSASLGKHAWNIIELDNKYYFVDCTWDDQIFDEKLKMKEYSFFLVNYNSIRSKDTSVKEHTLDDKYYDTSYFYRNYESKFDEKDYNSQNENLLSNCIISVCSGSFTAKNAPLRPNVTIRTKSGKKLMRGRDYSLTYYGNKSVGNAEIEIKGRGKYKAGFSRRNFKINAKKGTPHFRKGFDLF